MADKFSIARALYTTMMALIRPRRSADAKLRMYHAKRSKRIYFRAKASSRRRLNAWRKTKRRRQISRVSKQVNRRRAA